MYMNVDYDESLKIVWIAEMTLIKQAYIFNLVIL